MQSRPRDASPLRTLTAAKESLAAARRAKEEAEKRIADSETEVAAAQRAVEAAKYSALIAVKPRALWKAYALWLFTPLVWPGAYLFYLGRDTHAWLHTVTFGGFGIGWLLDFFYIPLYVADQNEPDGYLEGVERRMSRYFSLDFLLLMPLRLLLILIAGTYFGLIFAYVLPKPLPIDGLTLSTSAAISYCVGMLAIALAVKLCACSIGYTRTSCTWRSVLAWYVALCAILAPWVGNLADSDPGTKLSPNEHFTRDVNQIPPYMAGTLGMMIGGHFGRYTVLDASPRANTARPLSVRLLVHGFGVTAFAAAGAGSFYLNGKILLTSPEGTESYHSGKDAFAQVAKLFYDGGLILQQAARGAYERNKRKSWQQLYDDAKTTLKGPKASAAKLLGVPEDAEEYQINKAYRKLALLHHPDKVEPERREEAVALMEEINKAKEILLEAALPAKHEKREERERWDAL